jgi:hypothetical protein
MFSFAADRITGGNPARGGEDETKDETDGFGYPGAGPGRGNT